MGTRQGQRFRLTRAKPLHLRGVIMEYERTEYDRITKPILERYERISQQRGCAVIPLSSTGQPADCHRDQYDRDHAPADTGGGKADSRDEGKRVRRSRCKTRK